jgi:hypothetical protein
VYQVIVQLNPPIPVLSPKGKAMAHLVIDYGVEHDLMFTCFQDDTGECWTWRNSEIRAQTNISIGRTCKPSNGESLSMRS